ncbi:glucose-6-phosphate isomerase [Bartonella sp. TP]|uniref:glucose-6-phosphate isomerase n=1 Tax=Bartonella sp. TP TaxID=3057550 RepID=UPI0025B144EB|nr:glucose-6-phosphate isomerase [Bartonella sp. TP]WJW79644.1 glucose-6-phosphate isomerase [Bartonella sp. TP]
MLYLDANKNKNIKLRDKHSFDKTLQKLKIYSKKHDLLNLKELFANDAKRFQKFSCCREGVLVDFSKMPIDKKSLELLLDLAQAAKVEERRDLMFSGEKINFTENREVLHIALRLPHTYSFSLNGENISAEVHSTLSRMEDFSTDILEKNYLGYTGKPIIDVVNIGIGGSDLGPRMAYRALRPYRKGVKCHFVSNIDAADIADCLAELNPETTLFVITSKTFTTTETLANANWAKQWLQKILPSSSVKQHFIAVTANLERAQAFGIDPKNCFPFWDWVGGRYSLWSAVGLPLMLAIGSKNFYQLLNGAHDMDCHFLKAPFRENLPLILGTIDYYKRVVLGFSNTAIVAYEQRLEFLPAYLQQLCMESNGKGVNLFGQLLETPSGSIIWGATGTNGQHAFFQLLHQGPDIVPVEFIVFAKGHEKDDLSKRHHNILLANCLAQSEALLNGRSTDNSENGFVKYFSGNRPSISIAFEQLTPYNLGQLLAMWEHRVFVEGVLLDINSFDQWGVELGKELAKELLMRIEIGRDSNFSALSSKSEAGFINQGLLDFLQKFNV